MNLVITWMEFVKFLGHVKRDIMGHNVVKVWISIIMSSMSITFNIMLQIYENQTLFLITLTTVITFYKYSYKANIVVKIYKQNVMKPVFLELNGVYKCRFQCT